MFDLPVLTTTQRLSATQFRLSLLDMGFLRAQLSVYMRFCTSYAQATTYCHRVEAALPDGGLVNIVQITDKQYERIMTFEGKKATPSKEPMQQFDLFD
jgi:CRISPR-associated protein Cas2